MPDKLALRDGAIAYEILGAGDGVPLFVLHGGPAGGRAYMRPLAQGLADAGGRRVVLYDQLGCGDSDPAEDPALWTAERFAREVAEVRDALGLDRVHLLGESWGGWLALEYLATRPEGVVSLVLADTCASAADAQRSFDAIRAAMPADAREIIARHEAAGTYDAPEYLQTMFVHFFTQHLCRMPEWPPEMLEMGQTMMGNPVYLGMWGPNELNVVGTLRDWDRTEVLAEIDVPTLVTVGRYGELDVMCAEHLREGIREAELVVFERSAHVPQFEEPEAFLAAVRDFLARAEPA